MNTEKPSESAPEQPAVTSAEVTTPGRGRRQEEAPKGEGSEASASGHEAIGDAAGDAIGDAIGDEVNDAAAPAQSNGVETIGTYRVLMPIGEGGMGRVVLAHDPALDRNVALKLLPPEDADDEGRARFLREARALARVDHKNVVQVFASGVDGETAWMALEYIEGDPLSDLLDGGPLDEVTALELSAQIARGLGAVHAMGILHRDVKPSNLLLDDEGVLRVLDFGVALLKDVGGAGGFVTQKGIAVGTPHYMAPEQARGETLDARVDAWGLGATLFTMLTGQPPFYGAVDESDLEILARVLREPIPNVRAKVAVTERTARLVERLLTRDVNDRVQDLDKFADELEDAADAIAAGTEAAAVAPAFDVLASTSPPISPPFSEATPTRPDRPSAIEPSAGANAKRAAGVVIGVVAVVLAAVFFWPRENARGTGSTDAPQAASPPVAPIDVVANEGRAGPDAEGGNTAPPPPVDVATTPPLDSLEPDVLVESAPAPDQTPQGLAQVVTSTFSTGAASAHSGDDAAAHQRALAALVADPTPEASAALLRLLGRADALGDEVFAALQASTRRDRLVLFEWTLNSGPKARQLPSVTALEALRNVEAIAALGRASERHPSAAVRRAALRARKALFSVEGEE